MELPVTLMGGELIDPPTLIGSKGIASTNITQNSNTNQITKVYL